MNQAGIEKQKTFTGSVMSSDGVNQGGIEKLLLVQLCQVMV